MSQPGPQARRFLLRRVPNGKYEVKSSIDILLTAFTPTQDDTDGVSVHFADEISPQDLAGTARNPDTTLVVRIPEQLLTNFGLTVVASQQAGDSPGHAVIPELNRTRYEASKAAKNAIKEIAAKLAREATTGIVHVPRPIQAEILRRRAIET